MEKGTKPVHKGTRRRYHRRRTAQITADPLSLVRRGSSSSSGSYTNTSSSYNSDFTTSYVYKESSSSSFSCTPLTASHYSLVAPLSPNTSLPTIKTAWMSTPRPSRDLIPTPYSSRDDIPAGHNLFDNRPVFTDEDSISLSSFDSKLSKYMTYAQKYYDTTTTDLVSRSETETTKKDIMSVRPKRQGARQNITVVKKDNESSLKCTSLICDKHANTDCLYDEDYDGSVDSKCSSEYRGYDEDIHPPDPDAWRGNQGERKKYLKEESRGSVTEEFMDTKFSLVTEKANYYRSAYAYVPEERGNEQEVGVFAEDGDPFYVTAEQLSAEKDKILESIDKTCSSSRGVLPKLRQSCWSSSGLNAGVADPLGEDVTDVGKQNEPLPHGRGIRKSDHPEVETERSLSRLSRGSFEKDVSFDQRLKDDFSLPADLPVGAECDAVVASHHVQSVSVSLDQRMKDDFSLPADLPVSAEYDAVGTSGHVQSVSSRASVEKDIPDDQPLEAQYTPRIPSPVQRENEKRCESSLSRASIGPVSESEHNGLSLPDRANTDEQIEMEEKRSEFEGSRDILPVCPPYQEETISAENDKAAVKSTEITDYVPMVILESIRSDFEKSPEKRMQMHDDSEIKSYPAENYVPSPRSKNISADKPKVVVDLEQKKKKENVTVSLHSDLTSVDTSTRETPKTPSDKGPQKQTDYPDSTEPVKTLDSVSSTRLVKSVDSRSESHADMLKDNTMDNIPDSNDVKQERRHSSASIMSLNSSDLGDLKPGGIPAPSRKSLKEIMLKTDLEKGNSRSSSMASFASSRGADSEKISDTSGMSVNSRICSESKTPSRGSDSLQSSLLSSSSSKISVKKKLLPLDTHLLSSSGQTLTRGVESRKQRMRKHRSSSSKISTQSSTEEETTSQQTSVRVLGDEKITTEEMDVGTKSISQLSSSETLTQEPEKESADTQQTPDVIVTTDSIEHVVAIRFLEDMQASSVDRQTQKEDITSNVTSDSAVNDNPTFSSTSSETTDKDDTEQGSMIAVRWSTTSKDDLGSTDVSTDVSTSLTSSTFSDHTDISRGTENEVEGLVIDINSKRPLTECSLEQKKIPEMRIQTLKSETDIQILSEKVESDGPCTNVELTFKTAVPFINGNDQSVLLDTDISEFDKKPDFVLCSSTRSSPRSVSAVEQVQDNQFTVDIHAGIPVLVCSRGSEMGDTSDSESQLEEVALQLQALHQKQAGPVSSRELSPRVESRSSSNLSQASLTKVNLQQKEMETTAVPCIKDDYERPTILPTLSLHSTAADTTKEMVTGEPLSLLDSAKYEDTAYAHPVGKVFNLQDDQDVKGIVVDLKEQDPERMEVNMKDYDPAGMIFDVTEEDPWGLVFDLKEQDSERGEIVNHEESDHEDHTENVNASPDFEKKNEYRTKFEEMGDVQPINTGVIEDSLPELEDRGELSHFSDNGIFVSGEDQSSLNMVYKVDNTNIPEELSEKLEPEAISAAGKNDEVHACTTNTTNVETILKNEIQPSADAETSSDVLDSTKESQFKDDDILIQALASTIKANIQKISVSEVKTFEEPSSKEATNDDTFIDIGNVSLVNGTSQDQTEAYICVEFQESVQDKEHPGMIDAKSSDQGSNEILLINLYVDGKNLDQDFVQQQNGNVQVTSTPETRISEQSISSAPQNITSQEIYDATFMTALPIQQSLDENEIVNKILISHSPNTDLNEPAIPDSSPLDVEQTASLLHEDNSTSVKLTPLHDMTLIKKMEENVQDFVCSSQMESPEFQTTQSEMPEQEMDKQKDTIAPSPRAWNMIQECPPETHLAKIESFLEVKTYQQHQIYQDIISPKSEICEQDMKSVLTTEKSPPASEEYSQNEIKRDESSQDQMEQDVASPEAEQSPQNQIKQDVALFPQTDTPSYNVVDLNITPLPQTDRSSSVKIKQDIAPPPEIDKPSQDS
ncbi:uncharacterized protein LOC121381250 isoform X1 [Gigantopelta aegis]|uniref:uncharacterized protein LOC121381250 isoform X1 n=1 Tax=Gigantopelta aegis TaxID=1735272 RepID=UPI001B888CA1|nr:uncharacterized protein LOC121381250 isoform X1 [Gigantopelta aegis]